MLSFIRNLFMHQFDYLFVAEFTDGSVIKQTQDDRSKTGGSNCYSDVLKAVEEGKKIKRFSIVGKGHTLSVDLETGLFTLNGVTVILESDRLPAQPSEFKLEWWHRVSQHANATYKADDKGLFNLSKVEPLKPTIEYIIGWKCVVKDKEYTQTLVVH
jgi:hypothetical protein